MIRVIQSVGSLAPETGGPARSVPNLAIALAETGINVTILAPDLDKSLSPALVPEHELITYVPIPIRFRIGMKPLYIPELIHKLEELCQNRENLLIHDHGLWLPQNIMVSKFAARQQIPLVISPRGMLEPGALSFSSFRKRIAWLLYQRRIIFRADAIHATSTLESENLLNLGLIGHIRMIPNGTVLPPKGDWYPKSTKSALRILFLSRIHPKKGLINFVKTLSNFQSNKWEFIIAGYDEIGHLREVQNFANQAGVGENIRYFGPVDDQNKWELYKDADLFVLPSLSENFGIVVAEALAAGLPVITTTGTPWQDLNRYNCGWWVEPSEMGLTSALKQAFELPQDQLIDMGKRGRKLVEEKYSWEVIGRKTIKLYEDVLSRQLSSDYKTGNE